MTDFYTVLDEKFATYSVTVVRRKDASGKDYGCVLGTPDGSCYADGDSPDECVARCLQAVEAMAEARRAMIQTGLTGIMAE